MYERQPLASTAPSYALPLATVAIALCIIVIIFYAKFQLLIGRGILLVASLIIFLGTWTMRKLYRVAVGYGFLSKNTLIVGEGKEAEEVVTLLANTEDTGFKLFGIVASKGARPGEFIEGIPILGDIEKLREFVDVYAIETIIVASSLVKENSILGILRPLRYSGVQILDYVALYEELVHEIPLDHINDEWLTHAAMNSSVIHIRKIKRIMDFSVATVGLILSAPICIVTAIIIRLDSSGPVLFRQRRAGLDENVYTLYKFRTMKQDAEAESGAVWAGRYDSRVTRVGRFLRKWRIDEVPQLINVLKGEMSLVGPRPERPEFIDSLASAIPFYKERLMVPPGVTGWAQVKFPYAASVDAARRKFQYDLYYIKHMSFFLDVLVLLRTFKTIIIGIRYDEIGDEESPSPPILSLLSSDSDDADATKSA